MKVLQLIDTLEAGGAERMAINIANGLQEGGVSSYLCTTRRSGPLEKELHNSVTRCILNKRGTFDFIAFRRFFKWIRKEEITIIHAHSTSIFLAVLAKINNSKLKIVWHDHYGLSEHLNYRPARVLKILARYIDVCIAVNMPLENWSKEALNIKSVYFIQNFAQLSSDIQGHTFLEGVAGKRVLCLANLRPQKNHLDLVKSFVASIKNHPGWSLHLVGKSFNDEYSKAVENLIIKLDITKNVYLYGSCTDVTHILSQANVGVLSSHSEGLPVSLLEYGNSNLPVIVTNVGQCAEVVKDNGIVITNVVEEMPEALVKMYTINNEERKSIGMRFRENVLENYSKKSFLNKLIPIYKDLLS